jgi:hypothetical protein
MILNLIFNVKTQLSIVVLILKTMLIQLNGSQTLIY